MGSGEGDRQPLIGEPTVPTPLLGWKETEIGTGTGTGTEIGIAEMAGLMISIQTVLADIVDKVLIATSFSCYATVFHP